MKDWDDTETDDRARTAGGQAPVTGDDAEVAPTAEVMEAIEVEPGRSIGVPEADALDQALEVDLDDDLEHDVDEDHR